MSEIFEQLPEGERVDMYRFKGLLARDNPYTGTSPVREDSWVIATVLDRKIYARHRSGEVFANALAINKFRIHGRRFVLHLNLAQVLADGIVETLRQVGTHFQFEVNGG